MLEVNTQAAWAPWRVSDECSLLDLTARTWREAQGTVPSSSMTQAWLCDHRRLLQWFRLKGNQGHCCKQQVAASIAAGLNFKRFCKLSATPFLKPETFSFIKAQYFIKLKCIFKVRETSRFVSILVLRFWMIRKPKLCLYPSNQLSLKCQVVFINFGRMSYYLLGVIKFTCKTMNQILQSCLRYKG